MGYFRRRSLDRLDFHRNIRVPGEMNPAFHPAKGTRRQGDDDDRFFGFIRNLWRQQFRARLSRRRCTARLAPRQLPARGSLPDRPRRIRQSTPDALHENAWKDHTTAGAMVLVSKARGPCRKSGAGPSGKRSASAWGMVFQRGVGAVFPHKTALARETVAMGIDHGSGKMARRGRARVTGRRSAAAENKKSGWQTKTAKKLPAQFVRRPSSRSQAASPFARRAPPGGLEPHVHAVRRAALGCSTRNAFGRI